MRTLCDATINFSCQRTSQNEPLYLSTMTDCRIGPFARQAQASHLLACALRHVTEPTDDLVFRQQEKVQLDRTLSAFIMLLPEEIEDIERYCGAIVTCHR